MGIRKILLLIARKWWLIILLAIVGSGIGLMTIHNDKPVYEADARLYIVNKNNGSGNTLGLDDFVMYEYVIQHYSEIISSRTVTSAILRDVANYNLTEEELMSMININIDSSAESDVAVIITKGSDPKMLAAVAGATANEFVNRVSWLTNNYNFAILAEVEMSNQPIPNHAVEKILLWLMEGILVAISIIYGIAYFDDTIRTSEDIENNLQVHVIGIIPDHDIH